jgi:predicted  nucleic acid-binding Zn-ribbon protein
VALPNPADFWKLAKALDRLVSLETRTNEAFAETNLRLTRIEERLTRIEADRDRMVTEAKAAASTAASVAASAHLADLARSMGGLEERVRQIGATALVALPAQKRKQPKT